MADAQFERDSPDDRVRRPQWTAMNVLLLAWPFVPLVLTALLLPPHLVMGASVEPLLWYLLPMRLAALWFLAGMLLGAGVLLRRPADHLTRHDLQIPVASIGLNAALAWLCWVGGYRLPWPYGF